MIERVIATRNVRKLQRLQKRKTKTVVNKGKLAHLENANSDRDNKT